MSCSHAAGCPLFPYLRESLQGWRDYYCDSADQWQSCARYRMSLTGERVPISLLPNGAQAHHLESTQAETGVGTGGAAVPQQPYPQTSQARQTQQTQQTQQAQPDPYGGQSYGGQSYGDQSYRDQSYGDQQYGGQPYGGRSYEPAAVSRDGVPASPPDHRHDARPKRGWWARLTAWMGGPA